MTHNDDIKLQRKTLDEDQIEEARTIIDNARKHNVILRLIGGLAVRNHCVMLSFCEREHVDIDLIGLSNQKEEIERVLGELGYEENKSIEIATAFNQMEFVKNNTKEHVDVSMDIFKMEHNIDLRDRLYIEEYTISVSDILISKLQILQLNEKDVRDILTLVKDLPLGEEDKPGTINLNYITKLCSEDWGLYVDVLSNIDNCIKLMSIYSLSPEEVERIKYRMSKIKERIIQSRKTLKWKMRAIIGKRMTWRNTVEDQGLTKVT